LRFNNRIEKSLIHHSRARRAWRAEAGRRAGGEMPRSIGLTASLPALVPGACASEWQVLSTDGHIVTRRFPSASRPAPR